MLRFLGVTLLGALMLFVWGAVSVLHIPWHDAVVLPVQDESAVLGMLQKQAPGGGVFAVPIAHEEYTATSPFAMVMYRPGGLGMAPGAVMGASFLTYWLATIVAAWLLPKREQLSYARRVLFFVGLGAFASVAVHLQNLTWMGYSAGFTLMSTFDAIAGWLLAGLVLAWFLRPRPSS